MTYYSDQSLSFHVNFFSIGFSCYLLVEALRIEIQTRDMNSYSCCSRETHSRAIARSCKHATIHKLTLFLNTRFCEKVPRA